MTEIDTVYVIYKNTNFGDILEVEAHFNKEMAETRVSELQRALKGTTCTGHGYWYLAIPVYKSPT